MTKPKVRIVQEKTKKDLKKASKKLKVLGGKSKKAVTKKYKPIYK